jgi:hypothetical protein
LNPAAAARVRGFTPYRAAFGLPILAAVKTKILLLRLLPLAALAFLVPTLAGHAASSFDVPLIQSADGRLEGVLAKRDFAFRLPEHVRLEPGSDLLLDYRSSPLLLDVSTVTVSINGRQIASARLGHEADRAETQERTSLKVPVPEGVLQPGWNRMEVRCLLQTTQVLCRDVDNPAAWLEFSNDTVVRVAYSDLPLFAELQRFPESLTEPLLMRLGEFQPSADKARPEPAVSLLVPWEAGDPELRTLLIAAARLGQTVYTPAEAVRVGDLGEFTDESEKRNGLLIAQRDDLGETPLPGHVKKALADLEEGEGLLAELIQGPPEGVQRRWILVSGADDTGLENAALALGSSAALRGVPSNPWIVARAPVVSPVLEKAALPAVGPVKLSSLPDGDILLRGLFRSAATRQVSFPPGFETSGSGYLDLEISHPGNLEKTSAFEVRLNDAMIGGVALAPDNAGPVRVRLPIPEGIAGRDPSLLTVSGYLDIGGVDCAHRHEERAWLNISGESVVDIPSSRLRLDDLSKLNQICLRDAFLRRAAILVPESPDPERNALLKTIGIHLGSRLPSMPVLWPQAALYGEKRAPEESRVEGRSGLVLGSAFEWPLAFGKTPRLVVEGSQRSPDRLVLRGEEMPKVDFDPSLSFVQLVASPWSPDEYFAAIGGLDSLGGNATVELLSEPVVYERLGGTVAALDESGRLVTYDVRSVQEVSLSDHVRTSFATGLDAGEIQDRDIRKAEAGMVATVLNVGIGSLAVLTLAGLFLLQRVVIRRRRRKNLIEEGNEL